jgi:hypothetical protein
MKTASSPADPNAPSFLTTLPPEVRNTIYEVLFKRDKPVLLHNADTYYPEPPTRSNYSCLDNYTDALYTYDHIFRTNGGLDQEFKHDFHRSLPVLLCCRQVYHECAGVWYGSNTFIVSRALHRHDDILNYEDFHYDSAYHPIVFAPRWLRSLGSHIHLLRKVWIDCNAICPQHCLYALPLELLPLVRLFGQHRHLQGVVTFAKTDRVLEPHDGLSTMISNESTARLLNNLLEQLSIKDALRIEHFATSDHLLSSLQVHLTARSAGVHGSDPRNLFNFFFEFIDRDEFRKLQDDEDGRHKLLSLPTAIQAAICCYAGICPSGVTIDLDTCVA